MINIIKAGRKHEKALCKIAEDVCDESPRYQDKGFSSVKVQELVHNLVHQPHMCAFVAEENGEVIGCVCGLFAPYFFSNVHYAMDILIYVRPRDRKGSLAVRLVKTFEDWAFKNGAVEVLLGTSTGIKMDSVIQLYEKLGYTQVTAGLSKKKVK